MKIRGPFMAIYVKEKILRSTIASATSDFVSKFRVIALIIIV